jgi:hypothetical protein
VLRNIIASCLWSNFFCSEVRTSRNQTAIKTTKPKTAKKNLRGSSQRKSNRNTTSIPDLSHPTPKWNQNNETPGKIPVNGKRTDLQLTFVRLGASAKANEGGDQGNGMQRELATATGTSIEEIQIILESNTKKLEVHTHTT